MLRKGVEERNVSVRVTRRLKVPPSVHVPAIHSKAEGQQIEKDEKSKEGRDDYQ